MIDENRVEIQIDIQDPESLPATVREALVSLSTALASEEVRLTDEMHAALQDSDEVSGFSFGKQVPLGRLPGSAISPTTMGWCIFKDSKNEGGGCGVYHPTEGGDITTKGGCSVYWI